MTAAISPLAGQRVLVTRAADQGQELAELLVGRGAVVSHLALIAIEPLLDLTQRTELARQLGGGRYHELILTSANAVRLLLPLCPVPQPAGVRVHVVGPATAAAAAGCGWRAEPYPQDAGARELAERLLALPLAGKRVLLALAEGADPALASRLAGSGAELELARLYRTVCVPGAGDALLRELAAGAPRWIVLTSGSTVRCLATALQGRGLPAATRCACIGPRTAEAARDSGLAVAAVAAGRTMEALVRAMELEAGAVPDNGSHHALS